MSWTFTSRLEEFPEAAAAWLRADPTRNTVPLTVLSRLRHGLWADDPTLGWLTDGGDVRGAVIHTPPYPVLLGDIPLGSVAALAETLRGRPISGVSGFKEQAEAFAAAVGLAESSRMVQRLYRLGDLRPPSSTGTSRPADEADAGWVASWMRDFMAEAEPENAGRDFLPEMRHRIAQGEMVLWVDAGRPVAMAAFSRPISGMSRIGPVYTPPGSRGRGYGSAVTHAATRAAQRAGADLLLLFTDLANPTSNSIYQNLGYRPVSDYASIAFAPPA